HRRRRRIRYADAERRPKEPIIPIAAANVVPRVLGARLHRIPEDRQESDRSEPCTSAFEIVRAFHLRSLSLVTILRTRESMSVTHARSPFVFIQLLRRLTPAATVAFVAASALQRSRALRIRKRIAT